MTVSPAPGVLVTSTPPPPKKSEGIFRERPPISFLERRGVQGGTPCKAPTQHHPAAAVLPVQWQGDNGGLMFTSASRWRRSRRTGQNGGSQAVRPPAGQGGDFRPRRKYYPVLDGHQARAARRTDRLTVRTGESARGERPRLFGGLFPQTPKQIQSKFKVKIPETLDITGFFGILLDMISGIKRYDF